MRKLTSSSAALPARRSPSPGSDRDSKTRAATLRSHTLQLLTDTDPASSSGKMSRVSCHQTEDGILEPSSGRWSNSGMGSLTEFWTLNTCEFTATDGLFLNDDGVSSLSDILEAGNVPRRYYLTAQACRGILRRAGHCHKKLPGQLEEALKAVGSEPPT